MTANGKRLSNRVQAEHDLLRGIWQLLRLHTFEGLSTASIGWLALFFYAIQQKIALRSLGGAFFGIFACYSITHGVFCMWNDICDRDFDARVARTKKRPLPSGMVTYNEAMCAFIIGLTITFWVTYAVLGEDVTVIMIPIWGLSFIYPLAKRAIWSPQLILGLTMAACVLPPWLVLDNDFSNEVILPGCLFGAIFCWLVYLDLIYASQDSADDKKAGVKSLAVWLGGSLKFALIALGLLQIIFFATAAYEAAASTFLWTFGICVWATSVPFSILALNPRDRNSGGRVFLWNAALGIYMAAVAGADVWIASR